MPINSASSGSALMLPKLVFCVFVGQEQKLIKRSGGGKKKTDLCLLDTGF